MTAPLPEWKRHAPSKDRHHPHYTLIGGIICWLVYLALQPLHTVQTLLPGKLAKAPEKYKMINFAWTREIARVNYEPLFRHIGEEDIISLSIEDCYQACQIHASGYNTARRPRNLFRSWH